MAAAAGDSKVIVVSGSGTSGFADGSKEAAKFFGPSGLCLSMETTGSGTGSDPKPLLLVADMNNEMIRRIALTDGSTSTYAGSGAQAITNGGVHAAALYLPSAICAAPNKPGCSFIGDYLSIRYCDGQTVSLIAGTHGGWEDGVGDAAQFRDVTGVICTSDGQTLYVCDSFNNTLRSVDLKTRTVKTICGDGAIKNRAGVGLNASLDHPRQLCFDRSPSAEPESVIFITTKREITRFEIKTGMRYDIRPRCGVAWCDDVPVLLCRCVVSGKLSVVEVKNTPTIGWSPRALCATSAGYLVVSNCILRNLFVINISSSEVERVVQVSGLVTAGGLALDEASRTVYVSDSGTHQIKSVALSDRYFIVSSKAQSSAGSSGGNSTVKPALKAADFESQLIARISDLEAKPKAAESKNEQTQKRAADSDQQIVTLKQQIMALNQQNAALTANLKAAESLAAAVKPLATGSGGSGGGAAAASDVRSPQSLSALHSEVTDRPANEWSAGAVIYWVERVFTAEHKSAQTSDFVKELRSCALGSSAEVVSGQRLLAFKMRDFRLHKLTDLESVELITECIDSLKDRIKTGQNIGSGLGSSGGGSGITGTRSGGDQVFLSLLQIYVPVFCMY